LQIDEHGGVLKITGDIGINVVEQLQNVLREFVRRESAPIFDLSEIETCDTAALQLLSSARKTAVHEGKQLDFVGLSNAILDASAVLGLALMDGPANAMRGVENAGV
jgi:anti-anti-sigma factor